MAAHERNEHDDHEDIMAMIRHNRWAIGWIAFVVTAQVVYEIVKGLS